MIDYALLAIIFVQFGVSLYREKKHNEHIKDLEGKIIKTNPQIYWKEQNEGKRAVPNEMARESGEETPIADIPMMEFTDRDFNIQLEGDPETPHEARARKQR